MRLYIIILISFCCLESIQGQEKNELKIGGSIGWGTQNAFPFNSPDYSHENYFIKGQLNKELYGIQKFKLELDFEPTYFLIKHQLLDPTYITQFRAPDYLEQRKRFVQPMIYSEFSFALGLIVRYQIIDAFSIYIMGSIAPTLIQKETERLAKGFAFSDIAGLGFSFKWQKIIIDLRASVRHLSNADLLFPNSGHNSINGELGILFPLNK